MKIDKETIVVWVINLLFWGCISFFVISGINSCNKDKAEKHQYLIDTYNNVDAEILEVYCERTGSKPANYTSNMVICIQLPSGLRTNITQCLQSPNIPIKGEIWKLQIISRPGYGDQIVLKEKIK
jgi:hypothetical protein